MKKRELVVLPGFLALKEAVTFVRSRRISPPGITCSQRVKGGWVVNNFAFFVPSPLLWLNLGLGWIWLQCRMDIWNLIRGWNVLHLVLLRLFFVVGETLLVDRCTVLVDFIE